MPDSLRLCLASALAVLLAGCPSVSVEKTAADGTASDGALAAVAENGVPIAEPKPLIWFADRVADPAPPEPSENRAKAIALADEAQVIYDGLNGGDSLDPVIVKYEQAAAADPSWVEPPKQLAGMFSAPSDGEPWLRKAAANGLDTLPELLDGDLDGPLAASAESDRLLADVRARYEDRLDALRTPPLAIRPEGEPPAEGWPIMLLLHGYGDTNASYENIAQAFADEGLIAIAVPGSVPLGEGDGFRWSQASADYTHRDLQAAIASPLLDGLADRSEVYLLGFSHGAQHALHMLWAHPTDYRGVVAIAPGGKPRVDADSFPPLHELTGDEAATLRDRAVLFVYGTGESSQPDLATDWKVRSHGKGWTFKADLHAGGHHFPYDWPQRVPAWVAYLKERSWRAMHDEAVATWEAEADAIREIDGDDVPVFPRREVVWAPDSETSESPADEPIDLEALAPERRLGLADLMKRSGRFDAADEQYARVLADDPASPTGPMAAYQRACNFALAAEEAAWRTEYPEEAAAYDKRFAEEDETPPGGPFGGAAADDLRDRGWASLTQAVESGFGGWPIMRTDGEIGVLRDRDGFDDLLATVETRYRESGPDWVGQPLAVRPDGEPPANGWPIVFLLHGYGDDAESSLPTARLWAKQGVLAVALPGSVVRNEGSLSWDALRPKTTEADIVAVLDSPLLDGLVNEQLVTLSGFSQGASHAMFIATDSDRFYRSVIALSPGGSLAAQRLPWPTVRPSQRERIVAFFFGQDEALEPYAELWFKAPLGSKVTIAPRIHEGGHEPPPNYAEFIAEVGQQLRQLAQ